MPVLQADMVWNCQYENFNLLQSQKEKKCIKEKNNTAGGV